MAAHVQRSSDDLTLTKYDVLAGLNLWQIKL